MKTIIRGSGYGIGSMLVVEKKYFLNIGKAWMDDFVYTWSIRKKM
jgi:hypothetical protein